MKQARVLIADDSRLVRDGMCQLLGMQADIDLIGFAEDGEIAVQMAQALRPDIVLLDLFMPQLGGLDALVLIKEKSPKTEVIIVSMHDLDSYIIRAFYSGAAGFVLKTADASQLVQAIRVVCRGCPYLSPQFLKGDVEKAFLTVRPNHCA